MDAYCSRAVVTADLPLVDAWLSKNAACHSGPWNPVDPSSFASLWRQYRLYHGYGPMKVEWRWLAEIIGLRHS